MVIYHPLILFNVTRGIKRTASVIFLSLMILYLSPLTLSPSQAAEESQATQPQAEATDTEKQKLSSAEHEATAAQVVEVEAEESAEVKVEEAVQAEPAANNVEKADNAPKEPEEVQEGEAGDDESRPEDAGAEGGEIKNNLNGIHNEYSNLAASLGVDAEEDKEMFIYQCQNIHGVNLKRMLNNFITSAGSVGHSDESDIVVVVDSKSNIPMLKEIAERLDQVVPQVLVEARVVEFTIDRDFEKELNLAYETLPEDGNNFFREVAATLGTPSPSDLSGVGGIFSIRPYVTRDGDKSRELTLLLRYLETRGKAKILSSPNLILQRGNEGSIITGEELPILTQTVVSGSISTSTVFKRVGIKLNVKPTMITAEKVRLTISPEVSTVSSYIAAGEGVTNPVIAVREATTTLEAMDGQIISIGGLLRNEELSIKRQVPVLGSIPVLGHLFRASWEQSTQTQLVLFLTIHILEEGEIGSTLIHRPTDEPEAISAEIKRMEAEMFPPEKEDKKKISPDNEMQ